VFRTIDLEINTDCNLKCSYCPNSTQYYRGKERMDPDLFLKAVVELGKLRYQGFLSLSLTGEPFLHPNLVDCVALAAEKAPHAKIVLFSNGIHMTRKIYEQIVSKIHSIRVTPHIELATSNANYLWPKGKIIIKQDSASEVLHNCCGTVDHSRAKARPKNCWVASYKMIHINFRGDALICCDDFLGEQAYGNIGSRSLAHIWRLMQNERQHISKGNYRLPICKRCNWLTGKESKCVQST